MSGTPCENLATKAELQQLRNEINTLFGQAEDNSGTIDVLQAGTLEGTTTASLLLLAGTAIQKIVIEGNVGTNVLQAIATGAAKFEGIKGNGIRSAIDSLNNLGKGAAKNLDKIKSLGSAVANNAGAILSVSSLALGIGNSMLSIGTLKLIEQDRKNNEFALNALSRDYTNMVNFISQNRSDIAIAQAANATNRAVIQEQQNVNAHQYQQILEAQAQLNSLANVNQEQNNQITQANSAIAAYRSQVEAIEDDVTEFKADLTNQAIELESALLQAEAINTDQAAMIEYLGRWSNAQQAQIDGLELQIADLLTITQFWQNEFDDLRRELGLIEAPSLLTGSLNKRTIYVTENERSSVGAGAGAGAATAGAVDSQNGILDLASGLAGTSTQIPTITSSDVRGGTSTFSDTLTDLIDQIDTRNAVEESDIQNIRDGVKADMETVITALLGLSVVPSLNVLKNQTSAPAIQQAAAAGVCDSSKPGGCLDANIKQPLQRQIGNLIGAGGTAFSAANNAILSQMQPVLNAVNTTVTTIKNTTNSTLGIISHADYGLEKIQNFAEKAWNFTKADKVLAVVNTMLAAHNAAMLTRNFGQTLGDVATQGFAFFKIKAPDGSAIDVNEVVGSSVENLVKSLVGTEVYENTSEKWSKANRILTAARGTVLAIRGMKEAVLEAQEVVGGWVAKIGNSFQDQGMFEDRTYPWMNPNPNFRSPFKGYLAKIDNLEDAAGQLNALVGTGLEFQESINETIQSSTELTQSLNDFDNDREEEQQAAILTNESPNIDNIDLIKRR